MRDDKAAGAFDGTLIRGADGALYMIPDDDLEAFRVPDEMAREANEALDQLGSSEKVELAPRQLTDQVALLPALQGPFGERDDDTVERATDIHDRPTRVAVSEIRP